jgi:hypothetical protein
MDGKRSWMKVAGLWVSFLVLHYTYDWLPIFPLKLVSGTDESVFQHMKIGFYAYLLVNVVEYLIRRKHLPALGTFIYSRMFTTTLVPWFVFILWYIAAAYHGQLPTVFLEILYANIAVILVGMCVTITEAALEQAPYNLAFRIMSVALFLVSISHFTIFTFRLPWVDVFADPYG